MITKVHLDMDGVLANMDAKILEIRNGATHRLPQEEFWLLIINTPNFWETLPLMPGAKELYSYVKSLNVPVDVLTAPSMTDRRCYAGKIQWLENNGFDVDNVNFAKAHNKQLYAKPHQLLIDDIESNCLGWISSGGFSIIHKNLEDTLKQINLFKELV